MRLLYIIIACITGILAVWLLWVTAKPRPNGLRKIAVDKQAWMLSGTPQKGNSLTTFTSFAPMYDAMLADIKGAERYVHVQFFKFEPDAVGQRLGAAMASRVAAGVEARLMYDDLVCHPWRWYYRALERQGVSVAGFGQVHLPFITRRGYYRNHRKSVIIDGRVAYVGGMNIADRYRQGLGWGCWRDTMLRIEGPAAAAVQLSFAADWQYACGQRLLAENYAVPATAAGAMPVHILTSGPLSHGPEIMHYTAALIDQAEHYAYLETPYFIPPEEICNALSSAARRGVDVRMLVPPRGDQGETTQRASQHNFARMMDAGMKIGVYSKGFLHSKIIVCDDKVGVVGSCNIDPRSYLLCEEIAAVVEDGGYAKELKEIFVADEQVSTYIAPDEWRRRSFARRCGEALANTISSQL